MRNVTMKCWFLFLSENLLLKLRNLLQFDCESIVIWAAEINSVIKSKSGLICFVFRMK